ncbi:universal stress protein [Ramlibacter tataouinensis]|uniref:UspA domain-containing protein n=1 Tax=Ramlibacter tataouinensis (strain ATCC BAA-407 / DSM 14655 / LMG 21543 / TTB310) TaxID=365046 RepID=F5Y3N2_RAMTT|nr:universal stress protein [Ramlibacter tataouinensis]AEG93689.1 Conserved hypothetical protein [Ramlibacter tataouinensis TTB310]
MFKRILVPLDGSEPSQHALAIAIGLARANAGQLRLIHMIDHATYLAGYDPSGGSSAQLFGALQDSARQIVAGAEASARQEGVAADGVVVDGLGVRLGDAVAKAASEWGADLIVVGTHGRRGPSRLLLGSGAEQIIRLSPMPVLVTRVPEPASKSA